MKNLDKIMKQWILLIAQYFISLGLHQCQYCFIACANLMIKGYFKFSCTPDGNDSEGISLFISAGLGNLLRQPQLTFLILPALQWILLPVFHIAIASIIALLHTGWEYTCSTAINTKYVTKYAAQGSVKCRQVWTRKILFIILQHYKFKLNET